MGLPQPKQERYTIEEYLRLERDATDKHEYRDGEIRMMAGGSLAHGVIISNLHRAIGNRLAGKPCYAAAADVRLRIQGTPLYTYPDLFVICGKAEFDAQDQYRETVVNPALIVEVLSPSTEAYDRGDKFEAYRKIDSLREYVLLSQAVPRIETFLRRPDGTWLLAWASGMQAVASLRSIEVELPLAEAYANVDFSTAERREPPTQERPS
jgi:Uma2 family endonuclease